MSNFKEGEIVILKTGGARMVIGKVSAPDEFSGERALCLWWNHRDNKPEKDWFLVTVLERFDKDEE